MKKLFLSAFALVLTTAAVNAQFTMTQNNAAQTPIANNAVFEFNSVGDESNLGFFVFNTTSEPIDVQVVAEDIINGDGSAMEVCFGYCYTSIVKGVYYPDDAPMTIMPGQHQYSFDDHMHHKIAGSQEVTYKFKFTQKDSRGIDVGTPYYITYIYNPNLATDETLVKNGIKVLNTVAKDNVAIQANEQTELKIYSIQGNLLNTLKLQKGLNNVMVSKFTSGIYLLNFKTASGKISTEKVIVK